MLILTRAIPEPKGLARLGVAPRLLNDSLDFLLRIHRRYSDLVKLSLGKQAMYLAVHPDMNKRITQENWKNYIKQQYTTMEDILSQGLVTSNGDHWLRQQCLIQLALHNQRIARMATVMVEEAERMLWRWEAYARHRQPVDIQAEPMLLTENIIVRTMFSTSLSDTEVAQVGKAFNNILNWVAGQQFRLLRPLRSWPALASRRYYRDLAMLEQTVYRLIHERQRRQGEHDDLLEMLISARDADTGEPMSTMQIRDEVMTIFLAGHETTAGTLSWILHLLAYHGDSERKLRAKYTAVLGGRNPIPADLPRLTYSRMVIDETLRLYPPTWLLSRTLVGPDTLGDYELPAGATVSLSPVRDPSPSRVLAQCRKFRSRTLLSRCCGRPSQIRLHTVPQQTTPVHREQRCLDGNADGVANDPATLSGQCHSWLPSAPRCQGHAKSRTTAMDGGQEGGVCIVLGQFNP